MPLQMLQRGDLRLHIGNMLFDERIDPVAIHRRLILKGKKLTNLRKVHPMLAAMPDEAQPCDILVPIQTVVGPRALGFAQQALLFVISDRHHLTARHVCQLADPDFHGFLLVLISLE